MPFSPIFAARPGAPVAAFALFLSVLGLALLIFQVIRNTRWWRRFAAVQARRGRSQPPAQGGWAWIWIFLIPVVMISYQLGGKSGRSRRGRIIEPAPVSSGWIWTALLVPAAIVLGFVSLALWARWRSPAARALKLANAGDIPGAIALIEARIAARRGAAGTVEANPYAPPAAAITPAAKRAQADDMNTLGSLKTMRQDWPAALALYEEADALAEGAVPLYRANRGSALVYLGRPDEGLAVFDEALAELKPDDHSNRSYLLARVAHALIELDRRDEARARLDAAEAAFRRITALVPGARKRWLAEFVALRSKLAEAAAEPDPSADANHRTSDPESPPR